MKTHWILLTLSLTFLTVAHAVDTVSFSARILDADTGTPIGCRIHLVDSEGNYQVPEGHSVSFYLRHFGETLSDEELDLQNRDMTWADRKSVV